MYTALYSMPNNKNANDKNANKDILPMTNNSARIPSRTYSCKINSARTTRLTGHDLISPKIIGSQNTMPYLQNIRG